MTPGRPVPWLLRFTVRVLDPGFRREFGHEVDTLIAETWARDIAPRSFPTRQVLTLRLLGDTIRRGVAQRMGRPVRTHAPGRRAGLPAAMLHDLRQALRFVRKQPGIAVAVAATLGIGIGAVTTVLGAMDAEMWRALPFPDADRLVVIQESYRGRVQNASLPNLEDWRTQSSVFSGLTGFDDRKLFTVPGASEPLRVFGAAVDGQFFRVMGIDPVIGRFIDTTDDRPESARVVVVGETFWRRALGADSALIGQTIIMNQLPYIVVGVAPRAFRIPDAEDLWVPLATHPFGDERLGNRGARILEAVGRLKPEAELRAAQVEMETIAQRLASEHPGDNADWSAVVRSLREQVVGQRRPAVLTAALAAASLLLLLMCVNVTNLLLARTLRRHREMSIRAALGAGSWRIARQLVFEGMVMGGVGGIIGLGVAVWGHRLLVLLLPEWFMVLATQGSSVRVFVLGGALAFVSGVLAGGAPAWFAAMGPPAAFLAADDARAGEGKGMRRVRDALVVVEVAIALTLLIGAGLLLRSYDRLSRVPIGFDSSNVLTALIDLPLAEYPVGESTAAFYEDLLARLDTHAAVTTVAATSRLPLGESTSIGAFHIEGQSQTNDPPSAHLRLVTTGFFQTLGIRLVHGRVFANADLSAPVVVVDDEVVRRHFGDDDPIGRRLRLGADGEWRTVVGVVGATRHWGAQYAPTPTIYFPHRALPQGAMTLAIKTAGDPLALAAVLREEVWSLDRDLAISQVQSLDEYVSQSVASPRFNAVLFTAFAGFAVVLAAVGLYALIAFGVAQRTREIGVRVALGARSRDVAHMVIRQAIGITVLGITIGMTCALMGGRVMEALLFEVSGRDAATFAAAPLLLLLITIVASALPAFRAARLDPVTALRGR